jgi:hypothetical protein
LESDRNYLVSRCVLTGNACRTDAHIAQVSGRFGGMDNKDIAPVAGRFGGMGNENAAWTLCHFGGIGGSNNDYLSLCDAVASAGRSQADRVF